MEFDSQDLVTILKQTRIAKGFSVRKMGSLLGISHQAYQKIENGQTKLSFDKFLTICRIMNVNVYDLMTSVDSTKPDSYTISLSREDFQTLTKAGEIIDRIKKDVSIQEKARKEDAEKRKVSDPLVDQALRSIVKKNNPGNPSWEKLTKDKK